MDNNTTTLPAPEAPVAPVNENAGKAASITRADCDVADLDDLITDQADSIEIDEEVLDVIDSINWAVEHEDMDEEPEQLQLFAPDNLIDPMVVTLPHTPFDGDGTTYTGRYIDEMFVIS